MSDKWQDYIDDAYEGISDTSDQSLNNPPRLSLLERFLLGNYFYVFSAVAFMLGCYLLMSAPFITGTVFMRTLKSFLVLQGYELLLLGSAVLITAKIGRGGDVVTLFLIGLVLLFDPTFFANAFHTILQGTHPVVPPLVCGMGLVLAIAKFEIFRRLLKMSVSWRFVAGLGFALCTAWLSGLVFRGDYKPADAGTYSYLLAWVPLLVTGLIGESQKTIYLPALADVSVPRISRLIVGIPPVLCALHQVELHSVLTVPYHAYLMALLLFAIAFALIRSARGDSEVTQYVRANIFIILALVTSLGGIHAYPQLGGWRLPTYITIALTVSGLLYGYGYWKHRSKTARDHLAVFMSLAVIFAAFYGFVAYGIPVLEKVKFPQFTLPRLTMPDWITTWRVIFITATVAFGIAAYRIKNPLLWLCMVWAALGTIFNFMPSGGDRYASEFWQVGFISLFIYLVLMRQERESILLAAFLFYAVGLFRGAFDFSTLTASFLAVETLLLLLTSRRLKDGLLFLFSLVGVAVLAVRLMKSVVSEVHPSLIALGVGIVLFAVGLWVTFQKQKLLEGIQRKRELDEYRPDRVK